MIILHGEDATKSYSRLIELTEEYKTKQFEVISFDAQDLEITSLRQQIGSGGLFGSSKCFVIKNLLSQSKTKNIEGFLNIVCQDSEHQIILWENKALSATILKKFPKAKVESFSISPVIFKFLDILRPQNSKNILLTWKKILIEGTEPEFVFAMLIRQFKLLIQAKSDPKYLKLAPYPARLINQQSTYFTLEHLLDIYRQLFAIDHKIKTGSSANNIENLLTNFFQKI